MARHRMDQHGNWLRKQPDLLAQVIDMRLEFGDAVQLRGEFTVDILNVPIDGLDQAFSAVGADGSRFCTLTACHATTSSLANLSTRPARTRVASLTWRTGRTGDTLQSTLATPTLLTLCHMTRDYRSCT